MKKNIKISKFLSLSALHFSFFIFSASPVLADDADFSGVAQFEHLEVLIKSVLGGVFRLGLIAVFVMLLYGGFRYLVAGGNPEANQKASGVITYAILGLALMIGAWFILRLIASFTGLDDQLLNFSILF